MKIAKYKPTNKNELKQLINDFSINLGDIDTSLIKDMSYLFNNTKRTNFDGIENWNVSNVEDMRCMFRGSNFNGNISNWNVSRVEDMAYMFANSKFNGDISKWNVSKVLDMNRMFYNSKFNGDISDWNISKLKTMNCMFKKSKFNQDISDWNVSKVKHKYKVFSKTYPFDVSHWNITYEHSQYKNSKNNKPLIHPILKKKLRELIIKWKNESPFK